MPVASGFQRCCTSSAASSSASSPEGRESDGWPHPPRDHDLDDTASDTSATHDLGDDRFEDPTEDILHQWMVGVGATSTPDESGDRPHPTRRSQTSRSESSSSPFSSLAHRGDDERAERDIETERQKMKLTAEGGASGAPAVIKGYDAVMHKIALLLNEEDSKDVTLCVKDPEHGHVTRFRAHRLLLEAQSDFFRALFRPGFMEQHSDELTLSEMKADTFAAFLKFIYSGEVSVSADNVWHLVEVGHRYTVFSLVECCCQWLQGHVPLTSANLVPTLSLAVRFRLTTLIEDCLDHLNGHSEVFESRLSQPGPHNHPSGRLHRSQSSRDRQPSASSSSSSASVTVGGLYGFVHHSSRGANERGYQPSPLLSCPRHILEEIAISDRICIAEDRLLTLLIEWSCKRLTARQTRRRGSKTCHGKRCQCATPVLQALLWRDYLLPSTDRINASARAAAGQPEQDDESRSVSSTQSDSTSGGAELSRQMLAVLDGGSDNDEEADDTQEDDGLGEGDMVASGTLRRLLRWWRRRQRDRDDDSVRDTTTVRRSRRRDARRSTTDQPSSSSSSSARPPSPSWPFFERDRSGRCIGCDDRLDGDRATWLLCEHCAVPAVNVCAVDLVRDLQDFWPTLRYTQLSPYAFAALHQLVRLVSMHRESMQPLVLPLSSPPLSGHDVVLDMTVDKRRVNEGLGDGQLRGMRPTRPFVALWDTTPYGLADYSVGCANLNTTTMHPAAADLGWLDRWSAPGVSNMAAKEDAAAPPSSSSSSPSLQPPAMILERPLTSPSDTLPTARAESSSAASVPRTSSSSSTVPTLSPPNELQHETTHDDPAAGQGMLPPEPPAVIVDEGCPLMSLLESLGHVRSPLPEGSTGYDRGDVLRAIKPPQAHGGESSSSSSSSSHSPGGDGVCCWGQQCPAGERASGGGLTWQLDHESDGAAEHGHHKGEGSVAVHPAGAGERSLVWRDANRSAGFIAGALDAATRVFNGSSPVPCVCMRPRFTVIRFRYKMGFFVRLPPTDLDGRDEAVLGDGVDPEALGEQSITSSMRTVAWRVRIIQSAPHQKIFIGVLSRGGKIASQEWLKGSAKVAVRRGCEFRVVFDVNSRFLLVFNQRRLLEAKQVPSYYMNDERTAWPFVRSSGGSVRFTSA